MEGKSRKKSRHNASFTTGAIALVFLIIGYQAAVFVHKAASLKLAADRDRPDTVYVYRDVPELADPIPDKVVRKEYKRPEAVKRVRDKAVPRPVESFYFDPNTVSVDQLQRLGFSEKQALSIENYRAKGGRFRRPSDFAKSFVVSDSVYRRLEPFISIPKLDINKADSSALVTLPGIGPWYAAKIIAYREALCGYSDTGQLLEIYRFDQERYDALEDLITCSSPDPYPIWDLSAEELSRHPYISAAEARGIVLFRKHHSPDECTVEALQKNGVICADHAEKLSRIRTLSPRP